MTQLGSSGVDRSSILPFQGSDLGFKIDKMKVPTGAPRFNYKTQGTLERGFSVDRKNLNGNPLLKMYNGYIGKIEQAIDSELNLYSRSEFIEPLKYSIRGGKRIRPVILVLAAETVGTVNEDTYAASCAVEFLHTESVIHDDIIDDETSRRHKEPFHIKYGYNTSILTGDFVLGLILNISSKLNNPRITKDLATTAMLMSEGEMIESRLEVTEDVTFDDYLKVIEYKTATAFEASARIGAVIGCGSETQIKVLTEYGRNIGIAYQIRDDLLDWKNEDKLFNLLIKKSHDPRVVFDKMEEMLKRYAQRARGALVSLPDSRPKGLLDQLIRFTSFKE